MKTPKLLILFLASVGLAGNLKAQFSSGSTGALGALNPTGSITIPLPPDGILNYTTINIPESVSVSFAKNARNTPVYLLATGDVSINGYIDVSGIGNNGPLPGEGGPGGFGGGQAALAAGESAGAGQGPGGGKPGTYDNAAAGVGSGAYRTTPSGQSAGKGATYGSRLLIPLIGGSGGGGCTGPQFFGGGGGGGAILIASNTKITFGFSGYINANGGGGGAYGGGSGGAIRLVASTVAGNSRTGLLVNGAGGGGEGRTRVDCLDRAGLSLPGVQSFGNVMVVFPNPLPTLSIIKAAGTDIAEGATNPVTVFLPSGTPASQSVTVRAKNFGGSVPVRVALIPEVGDPLFTDATINNTNSPADAVINVTVPINVNVRVQVWTR
jgi:hypothetical protein